MPKGVPLRRGERHLAVHVEDHPLEYARLRGDDPRRRVRRGNGRDLGSGHVRAPRGEADGGLTVTAPRRAARRRVDAGAGARSTAIRRTGSCCARTGGRGSGARYEPMLATASEALPHGRGLGVRAEVGRLPRDRHRLGWRGHAHEPQRERPDRSASATCHAPCGAASAAPDAVLDGEICALDERGRSRFSLLQEGAVNARPRRLRPPRARLRAARRAPARGAAEAARGAVCDETRGSVFVSPQFDDGEALLAAARDQELEGVVAKRLDSRYQAGRRATDWRKVKLRRTSGGRDRRVHERPGAAHGRVRRARRSAVQDAGGLRWVGNVGTGFSDSEIERLRGVLEPLERTESPIRRDAEDAARPPFGRRRGSSRGSWPRSSSRSGRTRAACGRPSTSGSVRTRLQRRCAASAHRCPR